MTTTGNLSGVYSIAAGGLAAASKAFAGSAADVVRDTTTPGGDDSLTGDFIDLLKQQTAFEANAAVLRAANRMYGSLLDMFDTDHRSR